MLRERRILFRTLAGLIVAGMATGASAQSLTPKAAAEFLGTWLFEMTQPDDLKGTAETVRILEKDGQVIATVQVAKFPPNEVSGLMRDGDKLVLSTTLRENGQPMSVVIMLKLSGDSMALSQMMESSKTIKRGTGKKQPN